MIPFSYFALEEVTRIGSAGVSPTIVNQVVLTDTIHYALESVDLGVSQINNNRIAGDSTYQPVDVTINVTVLGDSPTTCQQAYMALIGMVVQAKQWRDGMRVNPIQIGAVVQGAEATTANQGRWRSIILSTEASSVDQSPVFDESLDRYVIQGVTIQAQRRGRWIRDTFATVTQTVTPASNPAISAFQFDAATTQPGAAAYYTDIPAYVTASTTRSSPTANDESWVCTASTPQALILLNPTSATATGYTAVNDAAKFPYDGANVLRYTPTGTAFTTSNYLSISVPTSKYQIWTVFAAVRNNNAARSYQMRLKITPTNNTGSILDEVPFYTRSVVIDGSSVDPRIINLGVFSIGAFWLQPAIELAASATGSTLDISYIALVALDDRASRQVMMQNIITGNRSVISSEILDTPMGFVAHSSIAAANDRDPKAYQGDVDTIIPSSSSLATPAELQVLYLEAAGVNWSANSGGAVSISVGSRQAALVPH